MAKAIQKSVVVAQHYNPKWDGQVPEQEYSYKVVKLVNVVDPNVAIGKWLTSADLAKLINSYVQVTILPVGK